MARSDDAAETLGCSRGVKLVPYDGLSASDVAPFRRATLVNRLAAAYINHMSEQTRPYREIRASFTNQTVTVYQAYPVEIARRAVSAGTFVAPFKCDRMTWIKPSFLWMMYRSGWATKTGQEHILAVEILRSGFEWALQHACLSSFEIRSFGSRNAVP